MLLVQQVLCLRMSLLQTQTLLADLSYEMVQIRLNTFTKALAKATNADSWIFIRVGSRVSRSLPLARTKAAMTNVTWIVVGRDVQARCPL